MTTVIPITLVRGKTYQKVIRWETTPVVRKAITGIDFTNGAPRLTVTAHGLPSGWRAAVFGVKGPVALNAEDPSKLRDKDYFEVTVIDPNTIEFNAVNASNFPAYQSGGFIAYNTPHDLAGYTCRMKVKDKVGGTVLLSTEVADTPLNLIVATVDAAAKTLLITVSATDTASLDWKKGIYEIEMQSPGGVVESLVAPSAVTVADEVVT